jgi:hypothetical protein
MNVSRVSTNTVAAALRCAIAAGLILAAGPALACKGPNVLFQDDFRQIDDSWNVDPHADAVTIEDGKVKVKADPSAGYTVLYGGLNFDDADLCVTVQVPRQTENGAQVAAGPVFWAQDFDNYYTFTITPDGVAAIARLIKGRWHYLLIRDADGIKTRPGDKNVLRVTTPATPKDRARMDMIVGVVDSYGYGALIGGVAAYHLFPDFVGGKSDAMRKGGLENARKVLELAMKTRGSSPFIAGDLSLADLYLAPIMFYVSLTPDKDAVFDVDGFAEWWANMEALPSFKGTQPKLG